VDREHTSLNSVLVYSKMGTKFKFHHSNLKYSHPCLNRCTFHLAGIDILGCQDKFLMYIVYLNNRVSRVSNLEVKYILR